MRTAGLVFLPLMVLVACGPSEAQQAARSNAARAEAADSAGAATVLELDRAFAETIRLADALAEDVVRVLSPMPVMTTAEENQLRQFLNATHLARARELGVHVTSTTVRDSLIAEGRLVPLADSTQHWIVREGTAPTWVVPHVPALLELLGERFQERLFDLGLPPYRMEVTSALRTSLRQARLRGSNANAAAGASAHEFGTTVDLSYSAFAPPRERPAEVLAAVPEELSAHAARIVDLALESASARYSRELGRIFGEVLREAQAEGIVLVIYERQQTVHHVTVGRALAGEAD